MVKYAVQPHSAALGCATYLVIADVGALITGVAACNTTLTANGKENAMSSCCCTQDEMQVLTTHLVPQQYTDLLSLSTAHVWLLSSFEKISTA